MTLSKQVAKNYLIFNHMVLTMTVRVHRPSRAMSGEKNDRRQC